jgi:phosphosulfolactate synthase (CoM biosynthesis protein A)
VREGRLSRKWEFSLEQAGQAWRGSGRPRGRDVSWAIGKARRFLDAGAYMIITESEGTTESVKAWRTDVPAKIIEALGLERVMFEAADL